MRSLNGNRFEVQLVVVFEFTLAEGDRFLAAKAEDRPRVLSELLATRHPIPEQSGYNAEQFKAALAQALVNVRERELKQLPESASPDAAQLA